MQGCSHSRSVLKETEKPDKSKLVEVSWGQWDEGAAVAGSTRKRLTETLGISWEWVPIPSGVPTFKHVLEDGLPQWKAIKYKERCNSPSDPRKDQQRHPEMSVPMAGSPGVGLARPQRPCPVQHTCLSPAPSQAEGFTQIRNNPNVSFSMTTNY